MLRRAGPSLRHVLLERTNGVGHSLRFSKAKMSRPVQARRLEGVDKNIWVEFVKLAATYSTVNLGQGFPDFPPPDFLTEAFVRAVSGEDPMLHQYTRAFGHPPLVEILAQFFGKLLGRELDPLANVMVTVGAYQALFCCFQALVDEGDEVIIIEPFFDCYEPMVKMAGGTPVFVPLRPKAPKAGKLMSSADWQLDPAELASKFGERTKAIVLNSPNNPLGKPACRVCGTAPSASAAQGKPSAPRDGRRVPSRSASPALLHPRGRPKAWRQRAAEPEQVPGDSTPSSSSSSAAGRLDSGAAPAAAAPAHRAPEQRVPLCHGRPGTEDGETPACPGYVPGTVPAGAFGNSELGLGQPSTTPWPTKRPGAGLRAPLCPQEAVAQGFRRELERQGKADSYFVRLAQELQGKRDQLVQSLDAAGLKPVVPEGTYFLVADVSAFKSDVPDAAGSDEPYDSQFAKWMVKNKGLAAIPLSTFYSGPRKNDCGCFIRFCFAKEEATLKAANDILQKWKREKTGP